MAESTLKQKSSKATGTTDIRKFANVSNKAQNIYNWIKWIINENLSLNFCEKEYTRKFTNLDPVCFKTIRKYIVELGVEIENCVK